MLFALLIIISAATADYKSIALYGSYDRWEGTISLLCYLSLFFVAANTLIQKHYIKYINYALAVVIGINLILAMLKFWGFTIIDNTLVQAIIIPSALKGSSIAGNIGSTFENPNYISGLFGPLTVYFFLLTITCKYHIKHIIWYLLLSVASLAIMLSSVSSSGFVAMLLVLTVLTPALLIVRSDRIRIIKKLGIVLFCSTLIFTTMYFSSPTVYDETFGTVNSIFTYINAPRNEATPKDNKLAETNNNSSSEFDEGTDISSGRFFIWSRTLDMVWNKPWLGHGAATLAYYFPQNHPDKKSI